MVGLLGERFGREEFIIFIINSLWCVIYNVKNGWVRKLMHEKEKGTLGSFRPSFDQDKVKKGIVFLDFIC